MFALRYMRIMLVSHCAKLSHAINMGHVYNVLVEQKKVARMFHVFSQQLAEVYPVRNLPL